MEHNPLAGILFFLAMILGGAALLYKLAAENISVGAQWAHNVCWTSHLLCQHPQYLAYVGGTLLAVAAGLVLFRSVSYR
jgi:hypothetical protein